MPKQELQPCVECGELVAEASLMSEHAETCSHGIRSVQTVEDVPKRCRRCGWVGGLRPDTCYGDGDHDFVPIPEAEWTPWQRRQYATDAQVVTRVIDGKFSIQGGQIVKTSSGEILPEWEPLMLQRGRDHLMLPTLRYYRELSILDGCNGYHLAGVDRVIAKFEAFAREYPEWMKQPGVTRGAAFVPTDDTNSSGLSRSRMPEARSPSMDDAGILWQAVVSICGGNVQREIREAYQRVIETGSAEVTDAE